MDIQKTFRSWFKKEKAHVRYWFSINEKIRFAIVASGDMVIRYLLFIALHMFFKTLHYQTTLILMWFLSSFIAFMSYKLLVFRTEGNHIREYCKSVLNWTISYLINAGILHLMVENLHLHVYLSQGAATLIILVINYFLFKHFAFRKHLTKWQKFLLILDDINEAEEKK